MADDFMGDPRDADIPPFEVDNVGVAFPEGMYLCALGKVTPLYHEGADPRVDLPEAVTNDVWILKYMGTAEKKDDQQRILIKDGVVTLTTRGTKIVERYPNPHIKPNMKWRAAAFFSPFSCIDEITSTQGTPPQKVVSWAKVKQKYGTLFKMQLIYSSQGEKRYRNIKYDTLSVMEQAISAEHMHQIEKRYDELKESEKASESTGSGSPPPALTDSDLPF